MMTFPVFANLDVEPENMPKPEVPDEVTFRWTGKYVAFAVGVCTLAGSFFTFTTTQYGAMAQDRQQIHDRLDSLESWEKEMKEIAKENTDGRTRIEQNQKDMEKQLDRMESKLEEHDAETRHHIREDRQ